MMAKRSPKAPLPKSPESLGVQVVKALMYIAAALALLWSLATPMGLVSTVVAIVVAFWLAERSYRRGMRVRGAVVAGLLGFLVGYALSRLIRDNAAIASALGVEGTVLLSDVLFFGIALAGALFTVRLLAKKSRFVTIVEAAVILFSVIYTFSFHREYRLNQPRFFSDWALTEGLEPTTLLLVMGVGIMILALIMFMRRPRAEKIVLTMVLSVGVGVGVYFLLKNDRIAVAVAEGYSQGDEPSDEEGSPDEDKDGDGKPDNDKDGDGKPDKDGDGQGGGSGNNQGGPSGGGGGGQGDSPYGQSPNQNKPEPVAIVTFHDDYESKEGVLYFRQQVQSKFAGSHLSVDTSGTYDQDVLTEFPVSGDVSAGPSQNLDAHQQVPTSMFLLADHPQPVALTHATTLRPLDNPDPRVFVAAYGVTSHVLSTDTRRLLGRKSIPESWDEAKRHHYLDIPDDPRYRALSEILVRDVDPRFADDDLMKALVIKRYLEKEGYYTLKETHTDASDPTASFLFGSLRGYCVHFAHSAVFLFRSQGIAARVAVGYGVDTRRRSGGSNLMILGNMAHAWPEIHLDGIGWVTFDVYPERSDEPPQQIVDQELANILGEKARKDPSGGKSADPNASPFPWGTLGWILLAVALGAIALAYLIKVARRLRIALARSPGLHRWTMAAALDRFADIGVVRRPGETRERFAERVAAQAPTLRPLTMAHLRYALGQSEGGASADELKALYTKVRGELSQNVPLSKRLLGAANPIGWWFVR